MDNKPRDSLDIEGEFKEIPRKLQELEKKLDETLDQAIQPFKKLTYQTESCELVTAITSVPLKDADMGFIYQAKDDLFLARLLQVVKSLPEHFSKRKIVFFTIDQLSLEEELIYKGVWIYDQKREICHTKIPPYIYNLVLHSKASSVAKMRKLRMMNEPKIINPINRFYQHALFEMIASDNSLAKFIIPYAPLTKKTILDFTTKFDRIYLLPNLANRNHRAIIVNKVDNHHGLQYKITYGDTCLVSLEEIHLEVRKIIKNKDYLIMQGVKELHWKHSPLEVRSYAQKEADGSWRVQGVISKKEIFSKGLRVDNKSEQFTKVLYPEYFKCDIERELIEFVIKSCKLLDYYIPNLASCFYDFIFDENGTPYLIRVGGFEQSRFLFKINENDLWKNYFKNTFVYLDYLINNSKQGV